VAVEESRIAGLEFVACDRIRFEEELIDGANVNSLEELRDELVEAGRQRLTEAAGRSVIMRARLTGASPIHQRLRPRVLEELLASLRDEFVARDPWLWWAGLDDGTLPVVDFEEVRNGSDFAADLVAITESIAGAGMQLGPAGVTLVDGTGPLGTDFLEGLLTALPRSLRERARDLASRDVLGAGLSVALNEIGAGEPVGAR
jgi:hypothetical protein